MDIETLVKNGLQEGGLLDLENRKIGTSGAQALAKLEALSQV